MEKYEQQYQDFKTACLALDQGALYNVYYKIGFYENLHDVIDEMGDSDTEPVAEIKQLIESGTITMETMFNEYMDLVWSSYEDWDSFIDFFNYVIDKYNK